jgi:TolB-like protein
MARIGLLSIAVSVLLFQEPALATTKKITILPFEIHSQKEISYIGDGIYQMLTSRLSWKERVLVAESNELPSAPNNSMAAVAAATNADYVLSGSITEFNGAFSVDTTVFNPGNNTSETFFGQAGSMEEIIPELDILAAKINHKLFDRKTAALEILKDKAPGPETFDIRSNPEKLMPSLMETDSEDSPFWKVWKNGTASSGHSGAEDRPFWKFWGKNTPEDEFGAMEQVEEVEEVEVIGDIDYNDEPLDEKEDKPFWKVW